MRSLNLSIEQMSMLNLALRDAEAANLELWEKLACMSAGDALQSARRVEEWKVLREWVQASVMVEITRIA